MIAAKLLDEIGLDMTVEQIASRLGLTKQAVLYHFSSKERVLVELVIDAFEAEADHAVATVRELAGVDALAAYVRGMFDFYVSDLERFRLMYLRGQLVPASREWFPDEERQERLYPQTGRMYGAVEAAVLRGEIAPGTPVRETVVGAHLATVGFATMSGATVDDPMVRPIDDYLEAMLAPWIAGLRIRA